MKITIQQKNFKKAIRFVERIVSRNISLPILNNILLKTENGRLKVVATNLEMGITCMVGAKIDETGELTVPGKILSDFVNTVGDENITLITKNNSLQISSSSYKTTILGTEAKEYPIIPKVKGEPVCKIAGSVLRNSFIAAGDAIATTETRPELAGLYMLFSGKNITIASTDSFRLVEKKIQIETSGKHEIIIPRNTVAEILRLTGETDEDFEIRIGENQISFSAEDVEIVSRLIDGKYPDYAKVIPEKFNSRVLVKKEDLEKGIRLAGLFSSNIADIKLQCNENKISVSAKNSDRGDAQSTIDSVLKNEPFEISLNYNYILDGIKIMPTEKIILEFLSTSNPIIIKPDNEKKDLLYLIMPLRN